ncbi:hypothetical protein CRG98_037482 [Punica granatum]|uniref:Uncharacterized protein n=1 Tax=Punica granatum TaxID=22663 RepID=A0A2I0IDH8_PUNGR|nr:hypothetical protein CRG98_037482 [Punica granatum]
MSQRPGPAHTFNNLFTGRHRRGLLLRSIPNSFTIEAPLCMLFTSPGGFSIRKGADGVAVEGRPVDGKDGLDSTHRLGIFLLDRRRRGRRLSQIRRYQPFPCRIIGTRAGIEWSPPRSSP